MLEETGFGGLEIESVKWHFVGEIEATIKRSSSYLAAHPDPRGPVDVCSSRLMRFSCGWWRPWNDVSLHSSSPVWSCPSHFHVTRDQPAGGWVVESPDLLTRVSSALTPDPFPQESGWEEVILSSSTPLHPNPARVLPSYGSPSTCPCWYEEPESDCQCDTRGSLTTAHYPCLRRENPPKDRLITGDTQKGLVSFRFLWLPLWFLCILWHWRMRRSV